MLTARAMEFLSRPDQGPVSRDPVVLLSRSGTLDRTSVGPPAALIERAAGRTGLVAAAVIAVSLLQALLSHGWPWLVRSDYPTTQERWDLAGNVLLVAVSVATLAITRSRRLSTTKRLAAGVLYLVLVAFVISLTDHADHFWEGGRRHAGIPWVTALILVFPVLIPMPRLPALLLGLVMAATGPLALWTHVALTHAAPPGLPAMLDSCPFLFALVAAYSAGIVHQLGREIGRARRLGAYTLESKLGSGGMGEVWQASHRFLARRAAVKLIQAPTATLDSRTALNRFEREAQATAALCSPHTVHVYDFGFSDDGRLYYAMELLDGIDLDTLIARFGPQPAERVVHWLRQVCDSLGEAHAVGLVHRDIKPANLYVCRYGREHDFLKVLDFGLASWQPSIEGENLALTATGHLVGTPAYMPPEMATGNGTADARSDLYALGCVAYYLLTAKEVFGGRSVVEVLLGHIGQQPLPPSHLTPWPIPEELDRIVLACLAKSPAERPQNVDELVARLVRCPLEPPWTQERARRWWEASQDPPAKATN
jgi:hypothetical protein